MLIAKTGNSYHIWPIISQLTCVTKKQALIPVNGGQFTPAKGGHFDHFFHAQGGPFIFIPMHDRSFFSQSDSMNEITSALKIKEGSQEYKELVM
ncbi:MAG: hypothetical protein NT144_10470 [Bacteroidia bacterium]|nr:hypothetical protein [Bacteroidia bacterium]